VVLEIKVTRVCTQYRLKQIRINNNNIVEVLELLNVISSQVLFHDGSLLHSNVQYTTVDYN
jgi:hypothetical protein